MIIKNFINYVGSKDRLLKQIMDNLDYSKNEFIDLCCGSGVVGLNVSDSYEYVHLNDACWQIVKTIQFLRDNSTETVLLEIDKWIKYFGLTKEAKGNYLRARDYYNINYKKYNNFNAPLFYALVTHAFSYNITFNAKEEFNVPAGTNRSSFNNSLRSKLITFSDKLSEKLPTTSALKIEELLDMLFHSYNKDLSGHMIYVDPPYFASGNDAPYGRIYGLKWTEEHERSLYKYLDIINEYGGSFLLSNAVENKGNTNKILEEWMTKYNVVEVDCDYKNCHYQRDNTYKTREIMVRNY